MKIYSILLCLYLHPYLGDWWQSPFMKYVNFPVGTIREFESDQPCDDEKVTKKEAALHLALSQLVGDFDRDSNLSLHRFYSSRYAPVISTGSLKLDQALGIGGLPKVIWTSCINNALISLELNIFPLE